jgi:TP901 family phage tail tape measure protein
MADISKTVEIVFGGKNELTKTIGGIEREFGQLDSMVNSLAAPLAGVADKILQIAAMAIGGIALAVNKSGKFGDSFREISTLIDASSGNIEQFRQDILAYATDSDRSLADINQAVYKAISAGQDYKTVLGTMKIAEELAQAGRNDLASTTVLLAGTMNAYGAKTSEAAKYADVFMQTVRQGLTTLPELAGSMANVTGIAAMGKVPIETLAGSIAALTATGIPTEQAITGMKNVIANIIKPTAEASEMAKTLGIEFNATALKTVLWDAWRATGGSAEKMNTLFGSIRGLNAATVLASDSSGRFKTILDSMAASGGVLATATDKMALQFEDLNQKVKNNVEVMLITIGDRLMPGYRGMSEGLTNIFKGIKIGVDQGAFDPLFSYLDQVGGSIATWLNGIAKAFPEAMKMIDFNGLIEALKKLGQAFGLYMGDLDLTNAKDLAAAIQILIDGVTGLVNITSGMVDAFRPFFNQIGEFLIKMAQSDEETQKTIGSILLFAKAIQDAGLGVAVAIMAMGEFQVSVAGVFDVLAGGAQIMFNGLQILLTGIKGMFLIVEGAIVGLADKLTFGLLPSLGKMGEVIAEQGANIGKSFEKDGGDAAAGLARMVAGFQELGKNAVESSTKTDKLRERIESIGKADTIVVKVDTKEVVKSTKVIDDAIPKEKKVAVTAKVDESKIKEQSAIIQKAMEFKAKIDIAEIEANAKIVAATFSNLSTIITSTGSVMGELFKAINDPKNSGSGKWALQSMLEKEAEYRKKAMEQSSVLTEQQIELNKLKLKALDRGDSQITVKADGLKPHLEMIMWEILEAIQIRASASQAEFLLGYS